MSRFLAPSRFRSGLRAVLPAFAAGLLLIGLPANPLQGQAPDRLKAPELDGAVGTLGSDKPIKLKDLRGKIVVLEFWTLC